MAKQRAEKKIKHQYIYDVLCQDIIKGVYRPGQSLPTEKELAKRFKASRPTIARAMHELQHEGLIVRRQGQGTFVRQIQKTEKKTLGLLVHWQLWSENHRPDQSTTIFGIMIPEILRVASQFNYSLLLNDIPEGLVDPVERARSVCRRLVDSRVSGVFFTPLELIENSDAINKEIAAIFRDAGIAVVLLDRDITDSYHRSDLDIVGINNEQASLVLTHHLIESGCKKIDFISSSIHTTAINDRIRGYRIALEENGMEFDSNRVHLLESKLLRKSASEDSGHELIRLVREKQVDAFICVNDDTASDVINFFLQNGVRIPEDVRVVGFDDLPTSQNQQVPLTTIRQPIQALALESIRTMLSRIENPEMAARDILVKTELVVRDSCGSKLKS
ncbi:Arabinose metabolism transcriptional repressor [Anaerohalosphaera lusitana]|uniref:Arabinose metabolism transcriptional repressor n=1 Tax=Anaerohalosphaera lusitana TaxID=1936003 RepID=A0A1U9NPH9_9BACT|nr:GntR family transcriptional regulator [Anaerohalosphaera lusitana]AQT69819.1 Arabinose metabolism transcriptional repressor [Anaerohalosphaera lusitana]